MNRTDPQTSPAAGQQPMGPGAVALTILTVALWGGTPTAVKYSLDTLPVMAVSGLRFAMAAGFMLFWCRLEGSGLRLRPGQRVPALIAGSLLFVQIGLFTWANQLSNASHSSLFINTFIFWVAGIEHFITRDDRLTPRKLLGLGLAALGVVLILLTTEAHSGGEKPADAPSLAGDAVMLTSALLLGFKIVYTKHAVKTVEPGKLIFWHDVIGVSLFAVWSLLFETITPGDFTAPAVLGLLYQGVVVAGFCFAVQARLLRSHTASSVSAFSFATPLFGTAIAILFRGDRFSEWLLAAAVCIAMGILLVNLAPGRFRGRVPVTAGDSPPP